MSDESPKRGRALKMVGLLLAILAIGVVPVVLQVDDWGRDLTTHVAATEPEAEDPRLRPFRTARSTEDVAGLVRETAEGLDGWEVAEETSPDPGSLTIHLVRTSTLFGFADDVEVRILDRGFFRLVEAESRSRVGKGDLGQNPRNLKALLGPVREGLGDDVRDYGVSSGGGPTNR